MKETRLVMGMPVTLQVEDPAVTAEALDTVYGYFEYVDDKFSTYRDTSEISAINRSLLRPEQASADMREVFRLAEETRVETDGYFDIVRDGKYDPLGLVKGWAIRNAANLLYDMGYRNFYVDAGGDVQAVGRNAQGEKWRVGIRNPFYPNEIVKVLALSDCGIATSGNYIRGEHIYNPRGGEQPGAEIVSLTVIGPDIYEADRFATAAFAMGREGIRFIGHLEGFEGYMIDRNRRATFTHGFLDYVIPAGTN